MEEIVVLKAKSITSVLSLFFQTGYSAFLGLLANLFLTILLSPKVFGIYITVLSIISLLNYFSDVGLAASLIQRKDIDNDDVKTAFTIQQVLVISLVLLGFFLTNIVVQFYGLPHEGQMLYWVLLFGFLLSSLKTIPSVFLERKIQYQKIVFVQIIENTVFYLTVIIFAFKGFGLISFAYGVLFRSIIGVIIIYSISFWMPKIGISKKSIKHLLSFGLPFQSISLMALVKDDLVNLFLGKIIGFEGLGYIGWAKKWGEAPLRIIMDSISRVMFPLFSRLQSDKLRISKLIEKIIYYQTLILVPTSILIFYAMPLMIKIIPRYHKWEMAVPFFYLFVFASLLSSFSTPFINLFNGLGKVKLSFLFMVFWTSLTWILILPLTFFFGFYGYPLTIFFLSFSFIFVLYKATKLITFNIIAPVSQSLLSGIVMALMIFSVHSFIASNEMRFIFAIILGGSTYYFSHLLFFKKNIIKEFFLFIKT